MFYGDFPYMIFILYKLIFFPLTLPLKDKFGILQLKPCFKIVPDEIE